MNEFEIFHNLFSKPHKNEFADTIDTVAKLSEQFENADKQTNYYNDTPTGLQQTSLNDLLTSNLKFQRPQTANTNNNGVQLPSLSSLISPESTTQPNVSDGLQFTSNPTPTNKPVIKTQTLTLSEIKPKIRAMMYPAAKALADKGHDPKVFMPMLQQAVNDSIAEHTERFNNAQRDQALSIINSNADYRAKFIAGVKAGFKPEILKMALDNGLDFRLQSLGNRVGVFGVDKHNGVVYDMTTGQPINADSVKFGVSPTAVYNKNTVSADNIYNKNTVSADTVYRRENPMPRSGSGGNGNGSSVRGNGSSSTTRTVEKEIAPEKLEKYSNKYDEIMSDIWDSSTPDQRAAKISRYTTELNALGQALDIDVQNDVDYITKTNPLGE